MTIVTKNDAKNPDVELGKTQLLTDSEMGRLKIDPATGLSDLPDLADSRFIVHGSSGGHQVERIEVPSIARGETADFTFEEVRGLMLVGEDPGNMHSDHPNYQGARFVIQEMPEGFQVSRTK